MDTPPIIADYAQVIQTSLAPVFLLAGTGGFVGIYVTRLGRVSDRLNEVIDTNLSRANRQRQLIYLRKRTLILQAAVILGVVAGFCTCSAILNLLSGALAIRLRPENLVWYFGGAIASLMASLVAFLFELIVSGHSMLLQIKMDRDQES
ncbi:DUF2721 domain-containing protein [Rhizobium mesoamericanum]|uniref:DUF2721 domain-containing protein n=1 Tax=Rhizobium mesoamericanum STM3625 TaxID=1211777 RepID=K0Q4M2_9HYPH|nr:DUF2721 domain-containing protein [Rhizobium mesoamericanum]CCM79532.1 conserved membrane hypothetical protein [Rhizobium mesoamericanum STM3625]